MRPVPRASTIVWIATSFRDEHRQALDWLNENTGEDTHFFGIELQVVRIEDSPYAPLFNVVVQPNDWQKRARAATQPGAVTEKGAAYLEFWRQLLERVQEAHPDWTRARSRGPHNWVDMRAPIPGCKFAAAFASQDRLRYELYIDSGDADENLAILTRLREQQPPLEELYGRTLEWEELPGRRACRVADYKKDCSVLDQARYDEFIDWLLEAGVRFRQALDRRPPPEG